MVSSFWIFAWRNVRTVITVYEIKCERKIFQKVSFFNGLFNAKAIFVEEH